MARPGWWSLLFLVVLSTLAELPGQTPWKQPPADIVKILDAPLLPGTSLDPTNSLLVLADRERLPRLADLARPFLRLAGLRIDPRTNGAYGPRGTIGLRVKRLADGVETPVAVPAGVGVSSPVWAPRGDRFAFTVTYDDGIEVRVYSVGDGTAKAVTPRCVNAAFGPAFAWHPSGETLYVRLVPEGRGPPPERAAVPPGPNVQETSGRPAPVRTYQDLLQDAHDETLFDFFATAELAVVDLRDGRLRRLGERGIFTQFSPSPDGRWLLVSRIVRPYSFSVPANAFPAEVEVRSADGKFVRTIAKQPLQDEVPIEGVQKGPRGHRWRPTADATILYTEALDGGDPKTKVPHRDRVMALAAPFDAAPVELLKTEHRFRGMDWLESGNLSFVSEFDRERRWVRTWLYDFGAAPGTAPRLVVDRSQKDLYADPGTPVDRSLPNGRRAILVDRGAIYLAGNGASPEGDRPFLDRLELATLEKTRLFRCEGPVLESVVDVLDPEARRLLLRRESKTEPPNFVVLDRQSGERKAVTAFVDPAPELQGITKRLVNYERKDGVKLSATLYLPPGYVEGTRLPLVVWAYPEEFNDPATAGQVSGSPYRFTQIGGISQLFFLLRGYAVLDGASMPVVGPPDKANDSFVEQIVASAEAAIAFADRSGVADPKRVGVGGHSYGAFMTANLLAHCDLFRAGIARSGAYNRTLTPFGFQNERRTFWEAPEVYVRMSPFAHAPKINEPLLMIHGENDANPGTFPVQSERLFSAIQGHGGTARLVLLPYEDHAYRARESVLHCLAEMLEWFDRHVKGTP